jgi:Flp pilus assembly protein TadG
MSTLSITRCGAKFRVAWRRKLGEAATDTRGVSAVEFGLVAAPFFALILAIVDVALIFMAQEALETAVEKSARLVLTGQATCTSGSTSPCTSLTAATFKQSVCDALPSAFGCGSSVQSGTGYTMSGVMVDLQPATSFSNANTGAPTLTYSNGNVTNVWQFLPGQAGSIEVMRVMYQWPVFPGPLNLNLANLSNGAYLLMATAVFRNEPQ